MRLIPYYNAKAENLQWFDMRDCIQCQLTSRAILLFPERLMLTCPRDQFCAHTKDIVTYFKISNVEYLRR